MLFRSLTLLLHFSGGIENPVSLVMLLHVILSGMMLNRKQCFSVAAVASGLFALMALAEWSGVVTHYTLVIFPHMHDHAGIEHAAYYTPYMVSWIILQTGILFLTAHFVTTLSERMRYDEHQLVLMAERAVSERQLLVQAMETTHSGLRVVDRKLHCHWANEQWRNWFGDKSIEPATDGTPSTVAATSAPCDIRIQACSSTLRCEENCPVMQTFCDGQIHLAEQIGRASCRERV